MIYVSSSINFLLDASSFIKYHISMVKIQNKSTKDDTPIQELPVACANEAAAVEIVRAVFLKGAGWSELWLQFTVLTAMAAGGLAFATDRFRRSIW